MTLVATAFLRSLSLHRKKFSLVFSLIFLLLPLCGYMTDIGLHTLRTGLAHLLCDMESSV